MKKLLTGILLAAIILQAAGCGAEKVPSGDGETTLTDAPETTTDAGTSLKAPDFPGVKMDGKEFNILTQGWCAWAPLDIVDVGITEQNGEILERDPGFPGGAERAVEDGAVDAERILARQQHRHDRAHDQRQNDRAAANRKRLIPRQGVALGDMEK